MFKKGEGRMVRINSFYEKEIISIIDGTRLGEISDIEINELSGEIVSIIISGKLRFFGLLGRGEPIIIPWGCVRVIGEETILVDTEISISKKNSAKNAIKTFLN